MPTPSASPEKEVIMSHLLYIKASPMGDLSYSTSVADAFVDAYAKAHPEKDITTLDVFYDDLPAFDFEAASAKYKVMHDKKQTEEEKKTWDKIVAAIDDFKAADKYVFAVPMWNFSIPYRLKQYIDVLVQPGLTFAVTQDGQYEGLVTGRPALAVYARGGDYSPGNEAAAFDQQKPYLELILRFIGFTDIQSIIVEPTLLEGPQTAARSKAHGVDRARALAAKF
jgi:FMN-dependent NADH-azoreductase